MFLLALSPWRASALAAPGFEGLMRDAVHALNLADGRAFLSEDEYPVPDGRWWRDETACRFPSRPVWSPCDDGGFELTCTKLNGDPYGYVTGWDNLGMRRYDGVITSYERVGPWMEWDNERWIREIGKYWWGQKYAYWIACEGGRVSGVKQFAMRTVLVDVGSPGTRSLERGSRFLTMESHLRSELEDPDIVERLEVLCRGRLRAAEARLGRKEVRWRTEALRESAVEPKRCGE